MAGNGADSGRIPELVDRLDGAAHCKPVKRSLTIAGHRTSISLEEAFWRALQDVARARKTPVAALIFEIDAGRGRTNLSSAIRVFLLEHFRSGAG
jgi:predicted DNA-binding ribbon-helix-helix protein